MGGPAESLASALKMLGEAGVAIRAISRFFATPCFPAGAGPDYVNAAALVSDPREPAALLRVLHEIEAVHGRKRLQRWGMRTLDLDLIAYDQQVIPDVDTATAWRTLPPEQQVERTPDQLILPHPRLQDRAFVLVPMADIAPQWCHPLTGRNACS